MLCHLNYGAIVSDRNAKKAMVEFTWKSHVEAAKKQLALREQDVLEIKPTRPQV